jgi:hypothetical protein
MLIGSVFLWCAQAITGELRGPKHGLLRLFDEDPKRSDQEQR